jgi:hypothetical protein
LSSRPERQRFLLTRSGGTSRARGLGGAIPRVFALVQAGLQTRDFLASAVPRGAKVKDTSVLPEGDYADGRRLAMFYSPEDFRAKTKSLRAIITKRPKSLEK